MAASTRDSADEALLVWSIVTLEAAARALAADGTDFHVRGDCAVALIGMRNTLRAAVWLLQELGDECEARCLASTDIDNSKDDRRTGS